MLDKLGFIERYGPWALVTGASSGFGAEFARQLGAMGMHLILVARRRERLQDLADELTAAHGVEVRVVSVDLAESDVLARIEENTSDVDVGLLINAAGFANTGPMLDIPVEDELRLLHVQCRVPLLLAHHFGNWMRSKKIKGGMIFLSSIVAFSAVPQWTNYAASKAYGLLLAEGLSAELEKHGISVLALCPGPTKTEFQQVARIRDFMVMDVQRVVAGALAALGHKRIYIPGWLNRYNNFWVGLFPRRLNTRLFGAIIDRIRLRS